MTIFALQDSRIPGGFQTTKMGFQAFNISMCRVVTKIAGYRFNSTLFLFFCLLVTKGA
jgi:hypothetical protein